MRIRINLLVFPFILLSYITNQIDIYILLMAFVLLHELGHMVTGIIFRLKVDYVEIMPFGFSVRFQEEYEDRMGKKEANIKKIIVALAGPVVNIICIIMFTIIKIAPLNWIYANLLIVLFNLLPIYPLDGGRILEGIFDMKMGYEKKGEWLINIAKGVMILLTFVGSILLFYYKNIFIFVGIFYMWIMVVKNKMKRINLIE